MFIGYHLLPGGVFAGDYYVVDREELLADPHAGPRQVKIHRVKEVTKRNGPPEFSVVQRLVQRNAQDTTEVPPTGGPSDKVEVDEPIPAPDFHGLNAASDARGSGDVSELSGLPTRKYAGSTRPPGIDPTLWANFYTAKDKREAIAEYVAKLEHEVTVARGAAPATAGQPSAPPRRIIELCTNTDSAIGCRAPKNCEVVRITAEDNILSASGMKKACKAAAYKGALLVIAIDCIGGCGWQHVNRGKDGGPERIIEHQKKFKKMLNAARRIAELVDANGGAIWFELGNSNSYWKDPAVIRFCEKFRLDAVRIDGCRFGLRGKTELIKKPWRIMTNNADVWLALHGKTCEGGHAHEICENSAVTSQTARYPDELAIALHVAFGKHVRRRFWDLYPATAPATAGRLASNCANLSQGGISANDDAPRLPREPRGEPGPHRDTNTNTECVFESSFPCCIARKVTKKEYSQTKAATAAMDEEWENLRKAPRPDPKDKGIGVWDESIVMEAKDARATARQQGKKAHFGHIAELCYEKGSELPDGHAGKVYKGRAVFLGNTVKDEVFNWAEVQELSSSPAQIEAVRALEALGLQPGYKVKRNDARRAYLQAYLENADNTVTYVHLPKNRWPSHWHGKYHDPVVPLILALYGHPESGGHWEKHCISKLKPLGYQPVPGWNSVFWHADKKALLVVYVDDFALAANECHHDALWKELKAAISMGDETEDGRFLGCNIIPFTATAGDVAELLQQQPQYYARPKAGQKAEPSATAEVPEPDDKRIIRGVISEMQDFTDSCIDQYCSLTGYSRERITPAPTPFLDESKDPLGVSSGEESDDLTEVDGEISELAKIARKVLMKIMYLARFARDELKRAIGSLATKITKWDDLCDKKMFRVIQFLVHARDWRHIGFIGDDFKDLRVGTFTDSDFAGDRADMKSTSGVFLALYGTHSFFPLGSASKKQGCVSHSSVEAELVACNFGIRTVGIPAIDLWTTILGRDLSIDLYQDNQATARIIATGKAPTLRHVHRVHQVCVAWLHERVAQHDIHLKDCHTNCMAADIFTKHFVNKDKFEHACRLIGIVPPKIWKRFKLKAVKPALSKKASAAAEPITKTKGNQASATAEPGRKGKDKRVAVSSSSSLSSVGDGKGGCQTVRIDNQLETCNRNGAVFGPETVTSRNVYMYYMYWQATT